MAATRGRKLQGPSVTSSGRSTTAMRIRFRDCCSRCPSCGTTLPAQEGYITWCHQCGWNLSAPNTTEKKSARTDRVYAALGKRLGDRLCVIVPEASVIHRIFRITSLDTRIPIAESLSKVLE